MSSISAKVHRHVVVPLNRTRFRVGRRRQAHKLSRSVTAGCKLHLGCGKNLMEGWLNIDIDRSVHPDVLLDLKFGLPMRAASASFIYSEHVLEHLSLESGQLLLNDCRHALMSGSVIRVAMPNLRKLVEYYLGDWREQGWVQDPAFSHMETPAEMLNVALREWGHQHVYDFDDLSLRLHRAGFVDVVERSWGDSPHPVLKRVETREESNLIVEATAP